MFNLIRNPVKTFAFKSQYDYNYTFIYRKLQQIRNTVANLDKNVPGCLPNPANTKGKGGSLPDAILKFTLLGLFMLLQVYLFFFKDFQVLDDSRYVNEHPLPLSGENKNLTQEFRTPGPLTRIDIMLANYKVKPKGGTLRLTVSKENQRLFLKNYPANTVEDNRFYCFNIDSHRIPRGNYRLRLDYFPQNKKEKLAVWISRKNLYPYGNLYVNGKQIQGDMTFRVYYRSTIWKEKKRWLKHVPQLKLRPYALITGFLLLLFMVNFLFYYFLKKLVGRVKH